MVGQGRDGTATWSDIDGSIFLAIAAGGSASDTTALNGGARKASNISLDLVREPPGKVTAACRMLPAVI